MVDRVSQRGRNLPVLHFDPWSSKDGFQAGRIFGVTGIPAWFLFDAQGKLVRDEVGGMTEDQLEAVLKAHGL